MPKKSKFRPKIEMQDGIEVHSLKPTTMLSQIGEQACRFVEAEYGIQRDYDTKNGMPNRKLRDANVRIVRVRQPGGEWSYGRDKEHALQNIVSKAVDPTGPNLPQCTDAPANGPVRGRAGEASREGVSDFSAEISVAGMEFSVKAPTKQVFETALTVILQQARSLAMAPPSPSGNGRSAMVSMPEKHKNGKAPQIELTPRLAEILGH